VLGLLLGQSVPEFTDAPLQVRSKESECQTPPRTLNQCGVIETSNPLLQEMVIELFPKTVCQQKFRGIDIALWCTRHFDDTEFALWDMVPNTLKDHSFLVALSESSAVPSTPDGRLDAIAEEQFSAFITIHPDHGEKAADALRQLLAQRVAHGRLADLDHAAMFLETHKSDLSEAISEGSVLDAPTEVQTKVPQRPKVDTEVVSTSDGSLDGFDEAARYLQLRANLLAAACRDDDTDMCTLVLTHCGETAETLAEIIAQGSADTEALRAFRDDLLMAVDGVVLMSLEDSTASAVDAVTVLLQLKKDLNMHLVA